MIDKKSFKWTMLFIFFVFVSLSFGSQFQEEGCQLCGKLIESARLTQVCSKCKAEACMQCYRDMQLGIPEKDANGQIKIIQGEYTQEIVRGQKRQCKCNYLEDSKFGVGSEVRLKGLKESKQYNGQTGKVTEYLGNKEGHHTYKVTISLAENEKPHNLKVKQKNLESADAPQVQEEQPSNILNETHHPILNETHHPISNKNEISKRNPYIEKQSAIFSYAGNNIMDFIMVIVAAGVLSTQIDPIIVFIMTVIGFLMKQYFSK